LVTKPSSKGGEVCEEGPLGVSGTVEWRPPVTPTSSHPGETNLVPWWVASAAIVAAGLMFSSNRRKAAVA
jgi:hypothetical protein